MQISPINNTNFKTSGQYNNMPNFGHTFRVSICIKGTNGDYSFVNPAKNTRLYKRLNKKIVSFLNEDFISALRNTIGIPRRINKNKTPNDAKLQKDITHKLASIDSDYKQANFVRSVYPKNQLGYIATGVDAPIIEEFMGADSIGVTKNMAGKSGLSLWGKEVRSVVDEFQQKAHDYVTAPTQLLRSKDNNEIMLRVNFNELRGPRGGNLRYEISDFDFQELKTKPLAPLTSQDKSLKKDIDLNWVAKRYVKHSFDKIYDKNKAKLPPQTVLRARDKFTDLISKDINIKHDIPIK